MSIAAACKIFHPLFVFSSSSIILFTCSRNPAIFVSTMFLPCFSKERVPAPPRGLPSSGSGSAAICSALRPPDDSAEAQQPSENSKADSYSYSPFRKIAPGYQYRSQVILEVMFYISYNNNAGIVKLITKLNYYKTERG